MWCCDVVTACMEPFRLASHPEWALGVDGAPWMVGGAITPAPRAEMFSRTEMVLTWRVDTVLARTCRPLEPALASFRVLKTRPELSAPPAAPSSGTTCFTCLGGSQ
jgi:hypothetical protein